MQNQNHAVLPYGVPVRIAGCFQGQLTNFQHNAHLVRYSEVDDLGARWGNIDHWFKLENNQVRSFKKILYFINDTRSANMMLALQGLNGNDACDWYIDYADANGDFAALPADFDFCPTNPCVTPVSIVKEFHEPQITLDESTTPNNVPVTVDVLANDTDPDGDALKIVGVAPATSGLVIIRNNKLYFTPDPDYVGDVDITYTVSDGTFERTGTLTVTTTEAYNDAPVAVDDVGHVTSWNQPILVDVKVNDTDADGDAIYINNVINGVHGSACIKNGQIEFTPEAGYTGPASVDYNVVDSKGNISNTATVHFTITDSSLNFAPVAVADSIIKASGSNFVMDVLANDTDAEGDSLTLTSVSPLPAGYGTVAIISNKLTFTLDAAAPIGLLNVSYTVSDGTSTDNGVVSVHITQHNRAPVFVVDAMVETNWETPISVSVVNNDTDADADTITLYSVDDTLAAEGFISIHNNELLFTPTEFFAGDVTVSYMITDGLAQVPATLVIRVVTPSEPPVLIPDTGTMENNATASFDVLVNDTDPEGDALIIASVSSIPAAYGTVSIVGNQLQVVLLEDAPAGTLDIDYVVTDGFSSVAGSFPLVITQYNRAPVSTIDAMQAYRSGTYTFDVVGNDTDADGDTISLVSVGAIPAGWGTTSVVGGQIELALSATAPKGDNHITYVITDGTNNVTVTATFNVGNRAPTTATDSVTQPNGASFVVTPLVNDSDLDGDTLSIASVAPLAVNVGTVTIVGTTLSFSLLNNAPVGTYPVAYVATDGTLSTNGTVNLTITQQNRPPAFVPEAMDTFVDNTYTFDVVSNDTDLDGDTVTLSSVSPIPASWGSASIVGGQLQLIIAASAPKGDNVIAYTITDGTLSTSVTTTFNVGNRAPNVIEDGISKPNGSVFTVSPIVNDSDPDGDVLSLVSVAPLPANVGTVTAVGNNLNFILLNNAPVGVYAVSHVVTDGALNTNSVVNLTVTQQNRAPVAISEPMVVYRSTPVSFNVVSNDTDADGDTVTLGTVTAIPASLGTATNVAGQLKFNILSSAIKGTYNVTYDITDGTATTSVTAPFTIGNRAPNAVADNGLTTDDVTPLVITPLSNDSDLDGDSLSITAVNSTSHGTSSLSGNNITFTPTAGYVGNALINYTVSDGSLTDTATITVAVTNSNSAPIAVADTFNAVYDNNALINFDVLANDTDADGDTLSVVVDNVTAGGTASVVSGIIVFNPSAGYVGPVTVSYTISDGSLTDTGSFSFNISHYHDFKATIQMHNTGDAFKCVVTGELEIDWESNGTWIVYGAAGVTTTITGSSSNLVFDIRGTNVTQMRFHYDVLNNDKIKFVLIVRNDLQTDASNMFSYLRNFLGLASDVAAFGAVTTMEKMFFDAQSMGEPALFDTSSCTSIKSAFENCYDVPSLPAYDFSNVVNFENAFSELANIHGMFPTFDYSSGTNFRGTWSFVGDFIAYGSGSVKFPVLNTGNGTNFAWAFAGGGSLYSCLGGIDTRNQTTTFLMFENTIDWSNPTLSERNAIKAGMLYVNPNPCL